MSKILWGKQFRDTTFKLFEDELHEYGYNTYWKVLNAKDYGIPQNRERVYLIFIKKDLDNSKFVFPGEFDNGIRLKDVLEDEVDEKYYLTNSNYIEKGNKRIFKHKNRDDIEYEVDISKYFNGGICGVDKHTKFAISSRVFSIYGNAPTLTACNTSDNSKIAIESEEI